MSKTKQLIKENNIRFKELWDKPSKKGFPTKDSVLITIAIDDTGYDVDIPTVGITVKVPGDEPCPKIGRAIAVRNLYSGIYDMDLDLLEKDIFNYLECYPVQKFTNAVRDRIKIICGIRDNIVTREY
jgi:hypothetical protein